MNILYYALSMWMPFWNNNMNMYCMLWHYFGKTEKEALLESFLKQNLKTSSQMICQVLKLGTRLGFETATIRYEAWELDDEKTVSSTYHLEFDLDTQALLLDGGHTCSEGFPHAGGPSQGELRAAFQTSYGARQHGGPAGPAHKQPTDILPVGAGGWIVFILTAHSSFWYPSNQVEMTFAFWHYHAGSNHEKMGNWQQLLVLNLTVWNDNMKKCTFLMYPLKSDK